MKILNNMKKDTETSIKNDQPELKNAISEINNAPEGINSRLGEAEDLTSDMKDKEEKNIQAEKQKNKRILKNEESLRNVLDNMKHNNICIMGIPGGEE